MRPQNITLIIYPVALLCVLLTVHIFVGSISIEISSNDAQRDFNTALGISLITSYLLFAIRYIHQNVAHNLNVVLAVNKQYEGFYYHRSKIAGKFKQHLIWSASFGFIMPIIYMISEGVISRINEPEVFFIAVTAIPFWSLIMLFFLQILTNNRYVISLSDQAQSVGLANQITVQHNVLRFGLTSAFISLFAMAIMPVFWINQPVHLLDTVAIIIFGIGFSFVVLWPMVKVIRRLRSLSRQLDTVNENKISELIHDSNSFQASRDIETLLSEKERYTRPLLRTHLMHFVLCLLPLPFSWAFMLLIDFAFIS